MASFDFDQTSGKSHIRFRYGGKPFKRPLSLSDDREAGRVRGAVEETIKDLPRGRLEMPEGADAGLYLISGGKMAGKPELADSKPPAEVEAPMTIDRVFARPSIGPQPIERPSARSPAWSSRPMCLAR